MTPLWFVQTVLTAVITFVIWGVLGWMWARRKLMPFLRQHAPQMLAMYEESEQAGDES